MISDYDDQKPYFLEKWVEVNVPIGEIQAENSMHFMTREEANEAKAKRQSNQQDVRRVVADDHEPRRESMGNVLRRRNVQSGGNAMNMGAANNYNQPSSSSSSRPLMKRRNDPLSFEDTPPPKPKRRNDELTFTP